MKAVTAAEAQVFCLASFGSDAREYEQPIIEAEKAVEAYLGYGVGPDSPAPIKLAIMMMVNGREFGFVKPWLKPYATVEKVSENSILIYDGFGVVVEKN